MPCADFSNVLRQDWLKDLAIADKKKIVESVQVNKSMPCCHGQIPFGTHTKEIDDVFIQRDVADVTLHCFSHTIPGILWGLSCHKQAPVYDKHSRQVKCVHTYRTGHAHLQFRFPEQNMEFVDVHPI